MYGFFILAWNVADASQVNAASQLMKKLLAGPRRWSLVVEGRGLTAFHSGVRAGSSEAVLLGGQQGAVFGKVFESASGGRNEVRCAPRRLGASESFAIVSSRGMQLVEHYWGRYVALLHDRAAGTTVVLRDPSGTLPCFMTTLLNVRLFFSDIEDCVAPGLVRFSIDWKHVGAVAAHAAPHARDTALKEVSELQPGERVELRDGSMRRSLAWHPSAIACREPIEDPAIAAAQIRNATSRCVHSWASCYTGIVHSLSGGLDSSIVLGCLAQSRGPRLAGLTHYGAGAEEDERKFARLAARRARIELVEEPLVPTRLDLSELLGMRRSPKPSPCIGSLGRRTAEMRAAATYGAGAIFSGAGGDALFYQGRADLAVADSFRSKGMRGNVLKVATDAALITGRSVWPLLVGGLCRGVIGDAYPSVPPAAHATGLLNPEVIRALYSEPPMPLWLEKAEGIGPGKRWHILSLSAAPAFHDPLARDDDPERTHPLLSQPLIELCLRIPAYVHIAGGWDRALARRAFAHALPVEITRRRAKGTVSGFSAALFDANIGFIRQLLLEGSLVRERILDREKLEQRLSRRGLDDREHSEILHTCVCLEAWLQRWGSQGRARES